MFMKTIATVYIIASLIVLSQSVCLPCPAQFFCAGSCSFIHFTFSARIRLNFYIYVDGDGGTNSNKYFGQCSNGCAVYTACGTGTHCVHDQNGGVHCG